MKVNFEGVDYDVTTAKHSRNVWTAECTIMYGNTPIGLSQKGTSESDAIEKLTKFLNPVTP